MDPLSIGLLAASILAGLGTASYAALRGWQGWLELRRFELTHASADHNLPPATGRIEIADLRERVRKLEAIAAGIDL
jgi:thioredoxin reductase